MASELTAGFQAPWSYSQKKVGEAQRNWAGDGKAEEQSHRDHSKLDMSHGSLKTSHSNRSFHPQCFPH